LGANLMNPMTAEDLLLHLRMMPSQERARFFALVGQQAFRDENLSHEEVLGHLAGDEFTSKEAAEYLEVSMPTFRRLVASGKLASSSEVGRSQLYAVPALKAFKRQRQAVKG
ncbi:helix-turn-helix domain-containing protein, partial [Cupriavidus basilensis]|uniref:helix-turn-helix domain-containing protein n=1 Tax=Cupriavidus basilensis TaxID=68895 RepID=UPI003204F2E8